MSDSGAPEPAVPASADEFIATVELLTECPIFKEPCAADEHVAAMIPRWEHIIGLSCLRKWTASKNDNAHKCPVCWAKLFDTPEPGEWHVLFLQRVWDDLVDVVDPGLPLLPRDFAENVLEQGIYEEVDWPERGPAGALASLVRMTEVMYGAIRLDRQLFVKGPEQLDEDAAALWYKAIPDETNLSEFSWMSLAWAMGELPIVVHVNDALGLVYRRDLLSWYTMRLLQYVGQLAHKHHSADSGAFDRILKQHCLFLGNGLLNEPS
ncbi:hypothetical protein EK21DRAFT_108387 [Setomelanomma holmii]|uniref:RING-type domain-containing protein n=1 Tax=Setomelanomma holmii TaxID=210430 RepID=A0A9P4HFI4_9PLEO|nr:hypothetical protein EK21DRAFT_108387 [Setomelanomma holmii]